MAFKSRITQVLVHGKEMERYQVTFGCTLAVNLASEQEKSAACTFHVYSPSSSAVPSSDAMFCFHSLHAPAVNLELDHDLRLPYFPSPVQALRPSLVPPQDGISFDRDLFMRAKTIKSTSSHTITTLTTTTTNWTATAMPASWSSHVPPGAGLVAAPAHISMPASEGSLPAPFNVPSKVSTLIPTPLETTMQKSCSICLRKPPTLTRLAILAHYGHALCSSCSTSALNIADEKDMECAGCQGKVANLKLVFITADEGGSAKLTTATASTTFSQLQVGVFDIMLSTPDGNHSFDFGSMDELDFFSDGGIQASTPLSKAKGMRRASSLAVDVDKKEGRGAIVLRIDDIPWDITPPRISA
ncbi:hypothetical protein BT96DRAFT_982518 [Gymnopus androsaceus JB14]|uniref:RING-type domain-containing protein n=1 Tax=Gymnopus androsaceus JB14 TaxID=1447944 RepID=A0A6A4GDT4_9AGAR|nr:hypothetical protein BT96DRAFT_982518 [Gymnopus androsaceus JB14]